MIEPKRTLLSSRIGGGGVATSAGIGFQMRVGALTASFLLLEQRLDARFGLGNAQPISIRFETEAPVDDILVATSNDGYVAIQAKTSASLSRQIASPLGKTVEQFVRHWMSCRDGDGTRGWDRPLDPERDRLVLAVGTQAPVSLKRDLAEALRLRGQASGGELTQGQLKAWETFAALAKQAWALITTESIDPRLLNELARLVIILVVDGEGDRPIAESVLSSALAEEQDSTVAFGILENLCGRLMSQRAGFDRTELRRLLMSGGIRLASPRQYRRDVQMLREHSAEVARSLERYEVIEASEDAPVSIERECQAAIHAAALGGSLLIVGEPGAGKSGVINTLARNLRADGKDVIELAVDRFSIETLEGLARDLRLEHGFVEALEAWDSDSPGWLIIDALDATRGGRGEGVFRSLIEQILSGGSRWRVVASIRTFDLKMGQRFRQIFRGTPPAPELQELGFKDVRHVKVPAWSTQEFGRLLEQVPELAAALSGASPRLLELAMVPFNTRLIGDLIRDGLVQADLSKIESQSELLRLYWDRRVNNHGLSAYLTLQQITKRMVEVRALRAPIAAVAGDPAMAELLSREGVITTVDNGRGIQFRHHLLFDYAASRLLFDPKDLVEGVINLGKDAGVGLMLAPALGFVLAEIWDNDGERTDFWTSVIGILNNTAGDPVIRSFVGRIAAELPVTPQDTAVLAERLSPADGAAAIAFRHIGGSLAIRMEDHPNAPPAAWTSLLARVASDLAPIASTFRFLLFRLLASSIDASQRQDLGEAARALFDYGFGLAQPGNLTTAAIEAVAVTFSTNPSESRRTLTRVFDKDRLAVHGWEEVPALCEKIADIATADPFFAGDIYTRTFGYKVTDELETRLGHSQILPLTSNARQDYEMAYYSLTEYAAKFLENYPDTAVDALVEAIEGWVAREHPVSSDLQKHHLVIGEWSVRLQEDWSHIWAHDPNETYGHDGLVLLSTLINFLRAATAAEADRIVRRIVAHASLAIFWARLFMVAAERGDTLSDILLPFATAEPFLLLTDTQKDAIDLIGTSYSLRSPNERELFEKRALQFDFARFKQPDIVRQAFLRRLFIRVGPNLLITEEARAAALADAEFDYAENDRHFRVRSFSTSTDSYYWLPELDREAPVNIEVMQAIDRTKVALSMASGSPLGPFPPLDETCTILEETIHATQLRGVDRSLAGYGEGIVGQALCHIVEAKMLDPQDDGALDRFNVLLDAVVQSGNPELHDDTEVNFESGASWGSPAARVEAAEAMLDLLLQTPHLYSKFAPHIDALLADPHPAVRLQAGLHLVRIWDIDRDGFWHRLRLRLDREPNQGVLDHLINKVLGRVLHAEPAIAEEIVHGLLQRFDTEPERQARMRRALCDQLAILWVTHGRDGARAVLLSWIRDAASHAAELTSVLATTRGGFVLGLEKSASSQDIFVRHRSLELANDIVEAASVGLALHFDRSEPTEDEIAEGTNYAKLLSAACRDLLFSSGVREGAKAPRLNDEQLSRFLEETASILRRIGSLGTPSSIHNLLQLLEALVPIDPPQVFDLMAHALRTGGKRSGYHFESLGTDLFVRLVGVFLADYKELFRDEGRRTQLAECLEIFMEAGWPAARRLLYRLPELVQ